MTHLTVGTSATVSVVPDPVCLGHSTLASVSAAASSGTAAYGFSGYFDEQNWTYPQGTTFQHSIDSSRAPSEMDLHAGSDEESQIMYVSITAPTAGTISFKWKFNGDYWSYNSIDTTEYPFYFLNGGSINAMPGYQLLTMSDSNTFSIPLQQGDVLGFGVKSVTWDISMNVTNFSFTSGGSDTVTWYSAATAGSILGTGDTLRFTPATPGADTVYAQIIGGGCPTPVMLPVAFTVYPSSVYTQTLSLCQGQSVTVNGHNYGATGTFTDTIFNGAVTGCDSIIVTHLTISPAVIHTQSPSLCQGQTVTVNGHIYNATGTFTDTIFHGAVGGCDSIIVTQLTIIQPSVYIQNPVVCTGQSVTVNGHSYGTTGTFRDTMVNGASSGCDSIIVTNLTISPAVTYTQSPSVCQGQTVTVNGHTYGTPGTFTDTIFNGAVGGCDSVIITTLSLVDPATGTARAIPDTICLSGTTQAIIAVSPANIVYSGFVGSYASADWQYSGDVDTSGMPSSLGVIDYSGASSASITVPAATTITFHWDFIDYDGGSLITGPEYSINGTQIILPGYIYGSSSDSGTFSISVQPGDVFGWVNYSGGDLSRLSISNFRFQVSATGTLANTTVSWYNASSGGTLLGTGDTLSVTPVASGLDTVYAALTSACSSTVRIPVVIMVKPPVIHTQNPAICQGSSVTVSTHTYSSTGVYIDTIVGGAVNGCDSVIITNLTVLQAARHTQNPAICQGGSVTVSTHTYSSTGVYIDTIVSGAANGCDSIITTDLTIIQPSLYTQNPVVCTGHTVTVNGHTYGVQGTYRDTIVNGASSGCDSIIVTNLTISPSVTHSQSPILCPGGSISAGIHTYGTTGTYRDTIANGSVGGCDSIVITNLTVLTPDSFIQRPVICYGGSVTVGASIYSVSGTYSNVLTAADIHGCDSTVVTYLTILPADTFTQVFTLCPGGSVKVGSNTYSSSGTYSAILTAGDIHGCD